MGLRDRTLYHEQRCFFVTTTCFKKLRLLDTTEAKDIIVTAFNFLTDKYECCLLGYVIMPNHLHFIIYFPKENRLSDFMRDFKKYTSVQIRQMIDTTGNKYLLEQLRYEKKGQKFKIWENRFDDVYVEKKSILITKLNYIHNNPLQEHWALSSTPEDYPYSSAAYYEYDINNMVKLTSYAEFW